MSRRYLDQQTVHEDINCGFSRNLVITLSSESHRNLRTSDAALYVVPNVGDVNARPAGPSPSLASFSTAATATSGAVHAVHFLLPCNSFTLCLSVYMSFHSKRRCCCGRPVRPKAVAVVAVNESMCATAVAAAVAADELRGRRDGVSCLRCVARDENDDHKREILLRTLEPVSRRCCSQEVHWGQTMSSFSLGRICTRNNKH